AVGPRFKEPDTEVKLEKTIINAMKLGEDNNLKQIAFPPMGAGFYAIPLDTCAKVMMKTLKEYLGGESSVQEVIICANDNREYQAFKPYFL
ncbi:MAG: macro domain-containing protein, partial [FCB group bacterium]|nr:macro domain-containing protein [FCB group bacterium]